MTFVLYGIKNCDTVKKARHWLEQHRIDFRFHDFRADGLDAAQAQAWLEEIGIESLINRRGTTWKQLNESAKSSLSMTTAAALLVEHPALIKRPVLDIGHQRFVGFSEQLYTDLFKTHTL